MSPFPCNRHFESVFAQWQLVGIARAAHRSGQNGRGLVVQDQRAEEAVRPRDHASRTEEYPATSCSPDTDGSASPTTALGSVGDKGRGQVPGAFCTCWIPRRQLGDLTEPVVDGVRVNVQ